MTEPSLQMPAETGLTSFRLHVGGLNCANCARSAEKALRAVDGVDMASVNFALERADVRADQDLPLADLTQALKDAGYSGADWAVSAEPEEAPGWNSEGVLLILAALLTLPLVLPMLFGSALMLSPLLQFALAFPVQFIIGSRFYRGAYYSLRSGSSNMDVLVVLGTSAAFLYSLMLMARASEGEMPHLYFEASAVIITLVLLGKWLEGRAKKGASEAIRLLVSLRPEIARIKRGDTYLEIPAGNVIVGDTLLVKPGERIPVDGRVLSGKSDIDASHITGESLPVAVETSAEVFGGSLNGSGALELEATALVETSLLSQIIELVENAQGSQAPIERLVDRVSAIFVPSVIGIAALTLMIWLGIGAGIEQALLTAISVLVIACPCALGLATPTALVAGLGAAAKNGILIKDIEALERAASLTHVAFDKTGTLTEGHPAVVGIETDGEEDELLRKVASLQSSSEHILGQAMVREAEARGLALLPITDFENFVGEGVSGTVDGEQILVGNASLFAQHNIKTSSQSLNPGTTRVFVGTPDGLLGEVYLSDPLRTTSGAAIGALKARALTTLLLSGDAQETADHAMAPLPFDAIHGDLKPQDKLSLLETLRAKGGTVAMVGDGINDAPALAIADVGIAIGGGTDVAISTASIALMRPDPRLVDATIDISRATARKIRQNLGWAFVYNLIGIPLAAAGFLSPGFAAAAMAMSSVSVVTNSLFLRRGKPKFERDLS